MRRTVWFADGTMILKDFAYTCQLSGAYYLHSRISDFFTFFAQHLVFERSFAFLSYDSRPGKRIRKINLALAVWGIGIGRISDGFYSTTMLPRGNLLTGFDELWNYWVVDSVMKCIAFSKLLDFVAPRVCVGDRYYSGVLGDGLS